MRVINTRWVSFSRNVSVTFAVFNAQFFGEEPSRPFGALLSWHVAVSFTLLHAPWLNTSELKNHWARTGSFKWVCFRRAWILLAHSVDTSGNFLKWSQRTSSSQGHLHGIGNLLLLGHAAEVRQWCHTRLGLGHGHLQQSFLWFWQDRCKAFGV